ncbi:5'-methylthioadenosine/S-adenosylhomocysteine nucleosidase [Gulosibacter faecalis]|jgi:adenosylhomocysteine nucleosidase|uniref:adenosylhomocysteine nucleosidase n=1 Tax=Gulosibacter faecalis TaxID=272240 RepID=A0ABW5UWB2_9MICO|nr:5'-methylthioadenosine/S-adenosylhomocysteine nucleosidase [Gulosibacter faecalis]
MIVVFAAMPEEAAPFVEVLADAREVPTPFAATRAWTGQLEGQDAVVATTDIGLAAAASVAAWALTTWTPRLAISAGTCGGLAAATRVAEVAVADSATYGTADATEFGYERGQVPRQPVRFPVSERALEAARALAAAPERAETGTRWHVGRILSGDTFVTARNVADMREAFPDAVGTDMETCAIAQVAHSLGVEFASVRGISDLCGPEAGADFHVGVDVAAAASRDAVVALLGALD